MNTYTSAFSATLLNMILDNPDIDLAISINVEQFVIDGYLNGALTPSLQTIHKIANTFNLDSTERLILYEIAALSYMYADEEDIPDEPPPTTTNKLDPKYIKTLPTEGVAWENLFQAAQNNTDKPNLSDQNDKTDTDVLAKALVWVRTGEEKYRNEVITAIKNAMGTESGAGILAVVRNITSYVLAAELINLPTETFDITFRNWLRDLRFVVFSGAGPSLSIIECHEKRPNNFGTHAGAARIAIAKYINDEVDLEIAVRVFQGWLGDRGKYSEFSYGDLSWQCDPDNPVGINPKGCTKDGHIIDGVLPDDQRRGGKFTWPPPYTDYVAEALQGVIVQGILLTGLGYSDVWNWSDDAIFRAYKWYHDQGWVMDGDDGVFPFVVNYFYNTNFPAILGAGAGKGFGWLDWLYG